MKKKYKRLFLYLFLLAVVISGFTLGYLAYYEEVETFYIVALVWIVTVILLLWFGNRYIYFLLDKKISWMSVNTSSGFFIQLVASTVYTLGCINITYYLFKISTNSTAPDLTQMMVLNIYGLLFIIPVLSINFGIYFMMQWKKAQLQANQLKEDNLQAQLHSLRMQIDPHFLFNNLNMLASLIDKDRGEAQDFLDKFADVYRYVLQYKKEELVSLSTEIKFINAYCHLLKKRFGEGLIVEIAMIPEQLHDHCIPPLSLQMLVENAVKHNIIARDKPLTIRVYPTGKQWVSVENTYQPLPKQEAIRAETGLENIKKRYQYLSELQVVISCNPAIFKVDLPLLEIDE